MHSTAADNPSHRVSRALIRSPTPEDREHLADEFSRLSEQTKRRRFGGLAQGLSERELDRLTNIDHHYHEAPAAIARDTDQIVGVARYIAFPNAPGAAEVAIEVADKSQGRGIGRRLMSELVKRARAEGIARLVASVSSDNHAVRGWIARAGGVAYAHAGDGTLYGIPLDQLAEERRAA